MWKVYKNYDNNVIDDAGQQTNSDQKTSLEPTAQES